MFLALLNPRSPKEGDEQQPMFRHFCYMGYRPVKKVSHGDISANEERQEHEDRPGQDGKIVNRPFKESLYLLQDGHDPFSSQEVLGRNFQAENATIQKA